MTIFHVLPTIALQLEKVTGVVDKQDHDANAYTVLAAKVDGSLLVHHVRWTTFILKKSQVLVSRRFVYAVGSEPSEYKAQIILSSIQVKAFQNHEFKK